MQTSRASGSERYRTFQTHSLFDVRSVDDEKRIIEGIATTPKQALDGDILETEGIQFRLPLPFLYNHKGDMPLGNVISAEVKPSGISVRIQVMPAGIAEFIDEKWRIIKAGGSRGLSIGWRTIQEVFDKSINGFRIQKSIWFELSAVAVPADMEATITSVRTADEALRAVSGNARSRVVRLDQPSTPASVLAFPRGTPGMIFKDQITALENKRAASSARQVAIAEKAASEGRTQDAAEAEEFEALELDLTQLDAEIRRLKILEKRAVENAVPVTPQNTATPEAAAATRTGTIQVRSMAPPGIGVARMVIAMLRSRGNPYQAIEIAKQRWGADMPEIAEHIRSVVEAGDTTTSGWASQLLPAAVSMDGLFLEMLRPMTVMGKLPLKDVPFNVSVPLQSGGGTYGYVGEGAPKPVTNPTYGSATLRFEKAAGIIVITEELFRFSSPKAEVLVRDEMLKGLSNYFDTIFLGSGAAVANVAPAGILNGISATASTGTTAIKFRYDMNAIIQKMITNNQDPSTAYLIMSSGIAMALSGIINSLGQQEFPTITAKGGNYLGIPIVVSQNAGTNIILIQPGDILLAEDPAIRVDMSREASVEMDTAPAGGESSPVTTISTLKSFWQNNLVGFRVEQYRTWKVARTSAVEYVSGAAYTPPAS